MSEQTVLICGAGISFVDATGRRVGGVNLRALQQAAGSREVDDPRKQPHRTAVDRCLGTPMNRPTGGAGGERTMRSPAVTPVTVAPERTRRATLALAWVGTLALSELLQVVLVEAVGIEAPPMLWIWLALAAVLLVVAGTWEAARPLRGYFTVMAAVIAALYLVLPLVRAWAGVEASSGMVREIKVRGSLFSVALGLAGFLLVVLRQRPRDVFLTPGNLQAPTSLRLPGMPQPPSWAVVGTITTTLLAGGFAAQMWLEGAFPGQGLQRLLPLAPLVMAVAALNAFGEEVIYRAGPLAFLVRVVGPNQAVLMTAAWFGLGHYYDAIPSGPTGAIQAAALGLLLGRAMVATKGLGWPWIIHTAIDLVIFASIAVAAT
jgi:membrane protease YdiL (CAAX protease family)